MREGVSEELTEGLTEGVSEGVTQKTAISRIVFFAKKTHKIIIYWLSTRFCLQRKT